MQTFCLPSEKVSSPRGDVIADFNYPEDGPDPNGPNLASSPIIRALYSTACHPRGQNTFNICCRSSRGAGNTSLQGHVGLWVLNLRYPTFSYSKQNKPAVLEKTLLNIILFSRFIYHYVKDAFTIPYIDQVHQ